MGSNLAKKTNEIKTLQRRLDTSKTEVEQAKAQNKASKAAMEQVGDICSLVSFMCIIIEEQITSIPVVCECNPSSI